jgi:hypothetical protein
MRWRSWISLSGMGRSAERIALVTSSLTTSSLTKHLHDAQSAPYLRYFNTKMKREADVPIDEELEQAIRDHQQRVLERWPRHGCPLSAAAREGVGKAADVRRQLPADAPPLAGDLRHPQ